MVLQLLVLIVAISPKASDSQSDPLGLAVRRDGLNRKIKVRKCCYEHNRTLSLGKDTNFIGRESSCRLRYTAPFQVCRSAYDPAGRSSGWCRLRGADALLVAS